MEGKLLSTAEETSELLLGCQLMHFGWGNKCINDSNWSVMKMLSKCVCGVYINKVKVFYDSCSNV